MEQGAAATAPPLVVLDGDGLITHVSDSAVTVWGYEDRKDVVGKLGREFWARPDEAIRTRRDILRNGLWQGSFLAKHRSGHVFPVYGRAWGAKADSGEGFIVLLVSTSEQSIEMLTLFGRPGVIALPEVLIRGSLHDLNNVISIAAGALPLIRLTDSPADSRNRETLKMVEESCCRAVALLKEMNTWLASWTVKGTEMREVSVGALAIQAARLATIGSKVEVQTMVPDNVWNVRCDDSGVFRVLVNLALNARQAMNNCGRLTVAADNVFLLDEGPFVRLSVSDTGPGMNEEVLARIFEMGFSTKEGGTGIGLAAAKHIIAQNGGRIEVDSCPGRGTTFRVLLPAVS